ncbi:MAG TPA: VCBS repeat-containing protein, partial [Burkholderiales bacterium]|nr:VCBS repeat-containing protein [Burkholderiales bacterium]
SASNEFSLVWTNATRPSGSPFYSVDVADIDGDGNLEVLAGGGREHTGADGVFIYAYDVATRSEEWHTLQLGSTWSAVTDLAVADTDADGDLDFVGIVEGGNAYVFNGPTHQLSAIVTVEAASLATRGTGADLKLMIGDTAGRMTLHRFDGTGYPENYDRVFGTTALDGLHRLPTGLWVGTNGTLSRYTGDTKIFETTNYGPGFGTGFAPVPGQSWVYSAGSYGVHGFKIQP